MAFGTFGHTNQLTASNAVQPLYGADAGRIYVSITNTHATVAAFISGDAALTATNGHEIPPGAHIEISGIAAQVSMYLIDTGGTHPVVTYLEITQT